MPTYPQLGVHRFYAEDVYGPLHALRGGVCPRLARDSTRSRAAQRTVSVRYLTGYTRHGRLPGADQFVRLVFKAAGILCTQGCHTGYEWYYDRDRINENLGFDTYYFLEDFQTEDQDGRIFLF